MSGVALLAVSDPSDIQKAARALAFAGLSLIVDSAASLEILETAQIPCSLLDGSLGDALQGGLFEKIPNLQLVISNLSRSADSQDSARHSLIRAAAFDFERALIITDQLDYEWMSQRLLKDGASVDTAFSLADRRRLAQAAFEYTAHYDAGLAANIASGNDLAPAPEQQRVLVIGSGGREHALAWKLSQSPRVSHVYVAPGNGGTGSGSRRITNVPGLSVGDTAGLVTYALTHGVGLVVVGPEVPLVRGVSDAMALCGIKCFGPSKDAARLEGSKAFSKDFMARHGIPTADFHTFTDPEAALAFVRQQGAEQAAAAEGEAKEGAAATAAAAEDVGFGWVIKASGLAAGKGVLLPATLEEAEAAVTQVMVDCAFGSAAGSEVVIERRLVGPEVSLLAFCDGATCRLMPAAQDHKRVWDGDLGLNTGGMGAYAPSPLFTPELADSVRESVMEATVSAMASDGCPFVGVLYAGLMLTPDGPRVLEYNCRFGDPETQVILPLLQSDLFTTMLACVDGDLPSAPPQWRQGASAATVVAAAPGYPLSYPKGIPMTVAPFPATTAAAAPEAIAESKGPEASAPQAAPTAVERVVFHAGTRLNATTQQLETSGGRVCAATAVAPSLPEALSAAYGVLSCVEFEGMQFRRDIGRKALPPQPASAQPLRVAVLGSTRGTDMQIILESIADGSLTGVSIDVVISNRRAAGILERARGFGVEALAVSGKGRSREEFDAEVSGLLEQRGIQLVLCIGYMRILSEPFVNRWWNRLLNVHPSLLPAFAGGMDVSVHDAVIASGATVTGCTVHMITHEVDAGPVVVQWRCPVLPSDSSDTLKARVQELEGRALLRALRLFAAGHLSLGYYAQAEAERSQKLLALGSGSGVGTISYSDAGVNIEAGNAFVSAIAPLARATARPGCAASLGGFGSVFDLRAAGFGCDDTLLVAGTDGVGTKLLLAQAAAAAGAATEGEEAAAEAAALALSAHRSVGVDLVAMCVNDVIVTGAEPLFFLDYLATGKLLPDAAAAVVSGVAAGCSATGCALVGGETAEMPGMYGPGHYDAAGFAVGAVRRSALLPRVSELAAGQVVLGLGASGVHSNGFSLVRKVIEAHGLDYTSPCPFTPPAAAAGPRLVDTLLVPTALYVLQLLPAIRSGKVLALAHITGGGLVENIPRVLPDDLAVRLQADSWSRPAVFQWLISLGSVSRSELLRTFNCGIGMAVIVQAQDAEEVSALLTDAWQSSGHGGPVFTIGAVEARGEQAGEGEEAPPQVIVEGELA